MAKKKSKYDRPIRIGLGSSKPPMTVEEALAATVHPVNVRPPGTKKPRKKK